MVFSELFAGVISHVVFAESVSRVLRRVYTFASPSIWVNEIESFSLCCTYMTRITSSVIAFYDSNFGSDQLHDRIRFNIRKKHF